MIINQHRRDELELALSCTDHEYRLPVKHWHKKTDYTTSGFSREEALALATEFYRDCGHKRSAYYDFFKARRTSYTEFRRVMEWFDFDIKRYYRVNGGQMYRMQWISIRDVLKHERLNHAITRFRNTAFGKGYADTKELFVELVNVKYSHYYSNPKEFFEVLRRIDISRGTYYNRIKKYGIKVEFFMSIDDNPLFPIKCKSLK
ncbi:hypothetical protein VQ237_001000 [Salmonella enterica]|nr:hypothetical protein [Salmonella enterica]